LAGLVALAPAQASARNTTQQSGLQVSMRVGYGDTSTYIIGEWFPVRVTLNNPAGANPVRLRLEIDSTGVMGNEVTSTYVREVDLPSPSRKEVTLYAYSGSFTRSLELRLVRDNTVIRQVVANIDPVERSAYSLVGVISEQASLLNALNNEYIGHLEPRPYSGRHTTPPTPQHSVPRAKVVHMTLNDILELSFALNSLDVIVIDGVDTTGLSEAQKQSLRLWIARGGTLVLMPRIGDQAWPAGLSDFLPVRIEGTRTLTSLKALGDLVMTPITPTSPLVVPVATFDTHPHTAPRIPAAQDGVPLVAMRDLGRGRVVYVALSPSVAPLRGWDGLVPLFKRILIEHPVYDYEQGMGMSGSIYAYNPVKPFDTYGNSIFDLPGLQLPEPMLIGLFLALYILVIGPVNFIVLRRMKRAELAWVTIPALVVLFSVGAYLLAYQAKGGDLVIIRAGVAHTLPGVQHSNASHYLGIFSPVHGTYTLQLDADGTINEFEGYRYSSGSRSDPPRISGGNPTTVNGVRLSTWTLRGFVSNYTIRAESPLEANLYLADGIIAGTVRNRTNSPLQDVVLIRGDAVHYIGHMAPGQQAEVQLNVTSIPFSTHSPTRLLPLPRGVVDPTSSNYNYGDSDQSDEQRLYNRRVELLNLTLPDALSQTSMNFDVIALAWGPELPSQFKVVSHSAPDEAINLWTSRLPVVAGPQHRPRLSAGMVPCAAYAPDGTPNWAIGNTTIPSGFTVSRYVDLLCRLPAGTTPESLTVRHNSAATDMDLLAYNVRTGTWDAIGRLRKLSSPQTGQTASQTHNALSIPNPADYAGPAGDVYLRILPAAGGQYIGARIPDLILNENP
jgi:hypothetical protein